MRALCFLLGFVLVAAALAQTPPQDVLFLNDAIGSKRAGRITGIDATAFKLQVPLGAPGATAAVTVPRSAVDRVEFAPNPDLDAVLARAAPGDVERVAALWRSWEPFLGVAKSPAPRIGVVYAGFLLRANDPKRAAGALALFTRIEREAWSDDEKRAARQGRLRAMVATGQAAEAVEEATELARESEDPAVLIEAKFILASAAHRQLGQLLAENPRWAEDVNVRPERHRLLNEALDLYLYPFLFFGSETDSAARGLWGAIEVHQLGGDARNAAESARDLTTLYPGTPFANRAAEILAAASPPAP